VHDSVVVASKGCTHLTSAAVTIKVGITCGHATTCHTRFLCQNQVLIVCMTHDQWFHTYGPKVFSDNQMSRIKYNYYICNVSKDYDDFQQNGIAEDSITPQERQPGLHVT
jgi:hypothetical protein